MTSLKRANSHESDFDISFQIINEHNELTSLTEVKDPNKGGRLYGGWRLGEEEGEEGEVGRITAEMERQNRLPFKTTIEMCKLSYVIVSQRAVFETDKPKDRRSEREGTNPARLFAYTIGSGQISGQLEWRIDKSIGLPDTGCLFFLFWGRCYDDGCAFLLNNFSSCLPFFLLASTTFSELSKITLKGGKRGQKA